MNDPCHVKLNCKGVFWNYGKRSGKQQWRGVRGDFDHAWIWRGHHNFFISVGEGERVQYLYPPPPLLLEATYISSVADWICLCTIIHDYFYFFLDFKLISFLNNICIRKTYYIKYQQQQDVLSTKTILTKGHVWVLICFY